MKDLYEQIAGQPWPVKEMTVEVDDEICRQDYELDRSNHRCSDDTGRPAYWVLRLALPGKDAITLRAPVSHYRDDALMRRALQAIADAWAEAWE